MRGKNPKSTGAGGEARCAENGMRDGGQANSRQSRRRAASRSRPQALNHSDGRSRSAGDAVVTASMVEVRPGQGRARRREPESSLAVEGEFESRAPPPHQPPSTGSYEHLSDEGAAGQPPAAGMIHASFYGISRDVPLLSAASLQDAGREAEGNAHLIHIQRDLRDDRFTV